MLTINLPKNNYYCKKEYDCNRTPYNPVFGYRLPKRPVYEIKDISKLNCGCCGNDMLTSDEIKSFLSGFAASSKRALEHSLIRPFKESEAYEFLKQLSQIQPKKTICELISMPENELKISTLDQRTKLSINHIAVLSEGITVKAPRVMQKLNKYYEYFSQEDKEILDLMELYSIKYPKSTFAEIFQKPEVMDYHKNLSELAKQQIITQRTDCFKKLRSVFKFIPKKDLAVFQEVNTEVIKNLNKGYKPDIKKAVIEELYHEFFKAHPQSLKVKRKINSVIKEFPYQSFSVDNFISDCAEFQKSDLDIVKYFVDNLQATFEHVHAKSKNGSDEVRNGIALCKKCNHERSDVPYRIFLRFHPEMKVNLQKQINKVITFIKNKKLINHDDYPMDIKQTVWDETEHIIKLKIDKYLKFREEKAAKSLELARAVLEKDTEKFNAASKTLGEIDARIDEVMAVIRKLKKERSKIFSSYNEAAEIKSFSEAELRKDENELNVIQAIKEYDKTLNTSEKAKRIRKYKQ